MKIIPIFFSRLFFLAICILPALATAEEPFFVSGTTQGDKFTAVSTGIYRFTITGGAYEVCPPESQPEHPELWGYKTKILIYKNRPIEWNNNPVNWDFEAGDDGLHAIYQEAEEIGLGMFIDISMLENEYVNLVANDCNGCFIDNSGGVNFLISINPPVASFTYPCNPLVGRNLIFDASASYDPNGTIVAYDWNFGDGCFGSGQEISHNYTQSGRYTITLTVTDNSGLTDKATVTLDVKDRKADLDKDNDIDIFDVEKIVYFWLESCDCPDWCDGRDINQDGGIDLKDFAILAHNWLKESGAIGVGEHVYYAEIWYDAAHDNPLDINQVEYTFDIEIVTDSDVERIEFRTPTGRTFSIPNDLETWDDVNQISTSRYFNTYDSVWEWEFEKYGSDISLFDDFGDGIYILKIFYADNSHDQTQVLFADQCSGQPLLMPTQVPRITFPAYQQIVEPPVTISWEQCTDPSVSGIWINLCNDAIGADFGSPFGKEQTSWQSVYLDEGDWYVAIDFDNHQTTANDDDIEVWIGKSRNCEQIFTVEIAP